MSSSPSSEHLEIALAIQVGVPHLERVAQGIRDYARTQPSWRFLLNPETHHLQPTALKGWRGDGVIALCNTQEDVEVLESLDCPVLNISGVLRDTPFPRVRNNYSELGRMAARFFRERGYRRLGFYGMKDVWYSEEIERGFREVIESQGLELQTHLGSSSLQQSPSWNHGQDELESWLASFTPPFSILAAHDPRAAMVVRACERNGLHLPSDAGVLGINDDTITCETCRPQLSSIDRNSRELGWTVAMTLDQMIRGETVRDEIIIPPGDLHERKSTGAIVTEHPALTAAVQFAGSHYAEPINVDQMASAAGRSRRWLEEAFRRELDRSPAEFLQRVRVDAATIRLEQEPSLNLGLLAADCGFSGTRQLNAAFLRLHGLSVRPYVNEQRSSPESLTGFLQNER